MSNQIIAKTFGHYIVQTGKYNGRRQFVTNWAGIFYADEERGIIKLPDPGTNLDFARACQEARIPLNN